MSFDYHPKYEKRGYCQGRTEGNRLDKTSYMLDFR
jgi:hypothetical protein